jgi:hypothetical protein
VSEEDTRDEDAKPAIPSRKLHIRFICKWCKRPLTGCSKKCDGPHKVEEVETCTFCKNDRKVTDDTV